MKRFSTTFVLAAALACLAGCSSAPEAPGDHVPLNAVVQHRQARLFFEGGRYADCIRAFQDWLGRYDSAASELGASARFHIALSYRKLGDRAKAVEMFRDICSRYAALPEGRPAAKWRRWAEEESKLLE